MNGMRFFLVVWVCLPFSVWAQSLLANGDFEEENVCVEFKKNCSPEGWINSSLQSNFYFIDAAAAYRGQHFIGLVRGRNGRYGGRSFIVSQLLCAMRKDAQYLLEFYVREGAGSLDSAGVSFTSDNLLFRKNGLKDIQPSLWIRDSLFSTRNGSWRKFRAVYRARGNESFLSIAVFKKQPPVRPVGYQSDFEFYLDAISLVPLDPREKLCPSWKETAQALYEADERHDVLERRIYQLQRRPPGPTVLTPTIRQRVDTLIIPDILFATNSFTLSQRAHQLLDSFSSRINVNSTDSLVVEGHTDSRGSRPLNEALSANRAGAVARAISEKLPGKEVPMQQRGWADSRPVADNNTPAGRQRNRRVEIYLYVRE